MLQWVMLGSTVGGAACHPVVRVPLGAAGRGLLRAPGSAQLITQRPRRASGFEHLGPFLVSCPEALVLIPDSNADVSSPFAHSWPGRSVPHSPKSPQSQGHRVWPFTLDVVSWNVLGPSGLHGSRTQAD